MPSTPPIHGRYGSICLQSLRCFLRTRILIPAPPASFFIAANQIEVIEVFMDVLGLFAQILLRHERPTLVAIGMLLFGIIKDCHSASCGGCSRCAIERIKLINDSSSERDQFAPFWMNKYVSDLPIRYSTNPCPAMSRSPAPSSDFILLSCWRGILALDEFGKLSFHIFFAIGRSGLFPEPFENTINVFGIVALPNPLRNGSPQSLQILRMSSNFVSHLFPLVSLNV